MKLEEYLKKYRLSKAEVARRCGIPYSTFFYACKGYGIQYSTMMRIIKECDGVTFTDLEPTKKARTNKRGSRKMAMDDMSKENQYEQGAEKQENSARIV